MSLIIPDSRVFGWLGNDDKNIPYYLHALNLYWGGDERVKPAMKKFLEVAKRLEVQPDYWSEIIRTKAWRHTLVGCTCILVSRNPSYFQDLQFSFKQGNWVSPQIAVTMGIVHPHLSRKFFREYLSSIVPAQKAKEVTSAQWVLNKLDDSSYSNEFDWNSPLDKDDSDIAKSVVENHWNFWLNLGFVVDNGI
ncbi:MAG TPA: hypothetical protein DEG17_03750 [Cyanobacteria bacterium UBA11149]|nr:hypothetical protein [Cyanobacteria bacterium UBA11367]HBE58243.1 hypothetical protein [Cyanobacteria bacterium UBA11366]HBK66962.1 hypothetical protein [Cyanobacteria bacterium UBA11166]HBR75030.1 hypothetical protein [Cyanobacteria bacterium UBA11159]HBS70769.1 hypothetical protein [Cyanobacteria bacterium UBA11153]HBW88018.1 hypothetical protein [Cyanobacteria bacterium UBA11149]HCA98076.1 hypothetical protein [Cyanobacteria bacterium UBA9226]